MEHQIIIDLIAYMQRCGVLSSSGDAVIEELAEICDIDAETAAELLD